MTTIKATCPLCGDVDLTPAQLRLVVASKPGLSYYAFTCEGCQDEVRRSASDDVIRALVTGGVKPQHWDVPDEALELKTGPLLTYDDLLDMHLAMRSIDALVAELEAGAR
ncbi:MAG: hypothetical protein ACTHMZ_07740 [Actinomycetes bacterium]